MSQVMSTTTSLFRKSLAAAPRVPFFASRMTLPACSGPASASFYSTVVTKIDKPYPGKTTKAIKKDGFSMGFTIDASKAPTISRYMDKRVKPHATERLHWSHRRCLYDVPPACLDTCVAWAEATAKTEAPTDVPITDPSQVFTKQKKAVGQWAAQDRVVLKSEVPKLAALGDSLFAELKKVVTEEDSKLHRQVNKEARWGVQCALLSRSQGGKEVDALYSKLSDDFDNTIGKDKLRVTGTWILNHTGGEKNLMEFPFEG